MKASELRIGNFYNQFGNITEVDWSVLKDLKDAPIDQLWCKPIPLTEEWLQKFGFEKIKNNREFFYSDVFKHENDAYNTWFCVYFFNYNATGESAQYYKSYFETRHHGKIEYLDNYGNFDYVHQLQNLFFALTGKELTIKK